MIPDGYRQRILGCWMGKNIGGTLGAPMEWFRQVNNVEFYQQELGGEPLPNDDLDIQLLWLIAMEEQGLDIDALTLGDYWASFVTPHWAEYGNAKINMRSGLVPPLSGALNNVYKDSCGCFIRTEIWACLCPGNPLLAAKYALQDGMIDHGLDTEGAYSAAFVAAMEAAAFVVSDVHQLLDIGLSYVPEDCAVAGAIHAARAAYKSGKTWLQARDDVLRSFAGSSYACLPSRTSPEDHAKGFGEGQLGWDVPSNMGILAIGLLYGEGDFDKTLCIAVNCGEDTDCTGATVGAMFGILRGIDAIPARWIEPIGHGIKTLAINLGDLQGKVPETIENLTDRVAALALRMSLDPRKGVSLACASADPQSLHGAAYVSELYRNADGPTYKLGLVDVHVGYPDGPYARKGEPTRVVVTLRNAYRLQCRARVELLLPPGWRCEPSPNMQAFLSISLWGQNEATLSVDLTYEGENLPAVSRMAGVVALDGRANAQAFPVLLLGDELTRPYSNQ